MRQMLVTTGRPMVATGAHCIGCEKDGDALIIAAGRMLTQSLAANQEAS